MEQVLLTTWCLKSTWALLLALVLLAHKWITAASCNPWTVVCSPTSLISRRCSSALAALPLCNRCWHHRWALVSSNFSILQVWFSSKCQFQLSSSSHSSQWSWQRNSNNSIQATMSTSLLMEEDSCSNSRTKRDHLELLSRALPTRMLKQMTKTLKRRKVLIRPTLIRHLEQYSKKQIATRFRYH